MLSAIIDSSDYKIKIYLKDNKYYGIKYSKGIYSPIYNIQEIINTFNLGSNSVLIEKINDYEIYIDKDTNYKHYIKNGIEDLLMFFKNNGESIIEYKNSKEKNNYYKRFIFKNCIIKTTATFMIFISCFASIDKVSALNIDNYLNRLNYVKENYTDITSLEVESYLNKDDFIKENNILVNEELLEDILPYIKDLNRKIELRENLKNFKIIYFDKNDILYEIATGYYNHFEPNCLYINENRKDDFSVYHHEFIHFLEDSDLMYLKEAVAELFSHEYYNDSISSYVDEITNLKILTEIVGKDAILKAIFSHDNKDLFKILDENLSNKDNVRLKELFTNRVPISIEEQKNINKEVLSILNRLYENIYHEKMLDNKEMFVEQALIYKIYFNKHQKEVMSLRKALELNIIKYQEIITNMDYIEQNNINFYIEDDNGKIHTNILVPNIEGVIIDGNIVYFESKDIKYNTSKSKLMN